MSDVDGKIVRDVVNAGVDQGAVSICPHCECQLFIVVLSNAEDANRIGELQRSGALQLLDREELEESLRARRVVPQAKLR